MSNDLVPAEESHLGVPAQWKVNPFDRGFSLWTSLNADVPSERTTMAKCARAADHTSDDAINTTFTVQHVLCHLVELTNPETGEIVSAIRSVLVSPGGERWAFVSKGVFDSLSWIGFSKGPPPWSPPINVRLISQQTRSKRRILLLELAE